MWNPPVLHHKWKVPEVHISSPEIQGFSLCWSLPSLWVTLKYAVYHKHSWSLVLFSCYIFLLNFWNNSAWYMLALTATNQGSEPLRWEVCQGRACGSKLLSICRTLLQSKREFTLEPEIVSLLRLTLCGILLLSLISHACNHSSCQKICERPMSLKWIFEFQGPKWVSDITVSRTK